MATTSEIAMLRRMTALDPDDPVYTDSLLGGMIDDLGMDPAVKQVWREKAAAVSGLVDITESGSSRALSGLRKGYLEMANASGTEEDSTTANGRSFTVEIERV
jgi:hypothetical protein